MSEVRERKHSALSLIGALKRKRLEVGVGGVLGRAAENEVVKVEVKRVGEAVGAAGEVP